MRRPQRANCIAFLETDLDGSFDCRDCCRGGYARAWLEAPMTKIAVCMIATIVTAAGFTQNGSAEVGLANTYIVKRDWGGVIAKYHRHAQRLETVSKPVVIDGVCASACTAYLRNACATPRARIGFHRAKLSRKARGRYKSDREKRLLKSLILYLDQLLASHYPPKVKRWISRKGGIPPNNQSLWLEGAEAQRVLGTCLTLKTLSSRWR